VPSAIRCAIAILHLPIGISSGRRLSVCAAAREAALEQWHADRGDQFHRSERLFLSCFPSWRFADGECRNRLRGRSYSGRRSAETGSPRDNRGGSKVRPIFLLRAGSLSPGASDKRRRQGDHGDAHSDHFIISSRLRATDRRPPRTCSYTRGILVGRVQTSDAKMM